MACYLDCGQCALIYTAVLSDKEVNEIFILIRNRYGSWKAIGLELGIDSAALDAIEKNYVNDHRRAIEMVDLWRSSVDLKPSHGAVVKALQSEKVMVTAKGIYCISSKNLAPNYSTPFTWSRSQPPIPRVGKGLVTLEPFLVCTRSAIWRDSTAVLPATCQYARCCTTVCKIVE